MATATEHYAEGDRKLRDAERAEAAGYDTAFVQAAALAAIASAHFAAAQAAAMLGRVEAPGPPPDEPADPFFSAVRDPAAGPTFSFMDNGGIGD